MNPRPLIAALLSSLVPQLLLLLLLLFPPSNPLPITNSNSYSFQESLVFLLQHFLSTSDIAAALPFLSLSRKRKRPHFRGPDGPESDNDKRSRLCGLGSVVSRNPDSFKQCFRMKASTFEWLCGLLEPLLECRDPVEAPLNLPAEIRLGIGLFRLATGADYPEIVDRFGVSEGDSKFCVKQLCRVLCTNYRFWVGFPSQAELDSVSTRFETLTGLPNCCGIIGCTRFSVENSDSLDSITDAVDRQQSIAAQIVVDSSSKILNVVAGFRGCKSDLQILKSSTLYKDVEKGVLLNSPRPVEVNDVAIPRYLIGNGEYPLLPWLTVPFANPEPGSAEESFNNMHRLMRVALSKAMASLRNWGVLNRSIKAEYKSMVACIGACCILHNMLIMRDDYSAFCQELDGDQAPDNQAAASLSGDVVEERAVMIRKALATRAKR